MNIPDGKKVGKVPLDAHETDSVNRMLKTIAEFSTQRDWSRFHSPRQLAAALAIEAGELQQTMLWKSDGDVSEWLDSAAGRQRVGEELADVLIYSFLLCDRVGVDPLEIMRLKIAQNSEKYPPKTFKGRAVSK